ncbi:MAG: uroporphyrinogen-III synthase [Anaerolineales bacterium]|nr:uroporphyrinogen-III synthase [Anaerolineales bacterium]
MKVEENGSLIPDDLGDASALVLHGQRVLITRAAAQAQSFVDLVQKLGGIPVRFPTIRTAAVPQNRALKTAIAQLDCYEWLIFTSGNAVKFFVKAAGGWPADVTAQVACVGSKTAAILAQHGIQPDAMPDEFTAAQIAAELGNVTGKRILLPQAEIARPELAQTLTAAGADVEAIATYRTVPDMPSDEAYKELEKGIDVATFTSPSTVDNFLYLSGRRGRDLLSQSMIACIGPTTAAAVNEAGFSVAVVPEVYTVEGMVAAIVKKLASD